MPEGEVIKVNGVRYKAVVDHAFLSTVENCNVCDYKKDHNGKCNAFCCEMELFNYHFERINDEKNADRDISKQ